MYERNNIQHMTLSEVYEIEYLLAEKILPQKSMRAIVCQILLVMLKNNTSRLKQYRIFPSIIIISFSLPYLIL